MGSGQRENGASAPTSVSYRFVRMRRTEERWGFRCGDRRHAEIDCGNKNRCDLDGRFDIRGFLASRSYPCVWVVRANAEAAGLPDATPAAIMQILKSRKMVSAVVGPEEARPLEEVGRPAALRLTAKNGVNRSMGMQQTSLSKMRCRLNAPTAEAELP